MNWIEYEPHLMSLSIHCTKVTIYSNMDRLIKNKQWDTDLVLETNLSNMVQRYHIYKVECSAKVGDKFQRKIEGMKGHDRYTVVITINSSIAEHMSREYSNLIKLETYEALLL